MNDRNKMSNLKVLTNELVECMATYIETLRDTLPYSVEVLDLYVNQRKLPAPINSESEESEVSWAIMFLGSALELNPKEGAIKYNDEFVPMWAYKASNPLQELLNKAERYFQLDFDTSHYKCGKTGKELKVFSLEDLAAVSGQKIGSIRNAANANGDLEAIKIMSITDKEGYRLNGKVFVEHDVALKWLQKKNVYEPLRSKIDNTDMFIEKISEYGPRFDGKALPDFLKLSEKDDLVTYYAPFEHINRNAKVVLCGITPGAQQAEIALNTLAEALQRGKSKDEALRLAKEAASFAGPMRKSLVKMLDHVGLHKVFGISSCDLLFSTHTHLVHYTSALRNPVFFRGQNYTGNPLMLKELMLRYQIDMYFKEEVSQFGYDTLYVPLGPKPAEALWSLEASGYLYRDQILDGIPHPSGANSERIKYFCEEKNRADLSSKTNAEVIDLARSTIMEKIQSRLGLVM